LSTPSPPLPGGTGDTREKSPEKEKEKLKMKERKILFSGETFLFFVLISYLFYFVWIISFICLFFNWPFCFRFTFSVITEDSFFINNSHITTISFSYLKITISFHHVDDGPESKSTSHASTDNTAESLAGSDTIKINPPASLSNTNLIVPNGHLSENDISNILESNMDSIIEQDNSNNSSYISNSNYCFTGSTGSSTTSTPIAPGKHGSFFASLLGGSLYQNRSSSILSPAFKSRANPTAAPNTTGHTSTMHDFVPESGNTWDMIIIYKLKTQSKYFILLFSSVK
jgi:hypothetical protein